MVKNICRKCKKEIHSSNLIHGKKCLYCYERILKFKKKLMIFFLPFNSFYPYTPILALMLDVINFLIIPPLYRFSIIPYIMIILFVVCFLGAIPRLNPSLSSKFWHEMNNNYQLQLKDYNPNISVQCSNHSDYQAISRCSACFQPRCRKDFVLLHSIPTNCQDCARIIFSEDKKLSLCLPLIYPLISFVILAIGIELNGCSSLWCSDLIVWCLALPLAILFFTVIIFLIIEILFTLISIYL